MVLRTIFIKSYLNEEVNCTEPSPSVSVPCKHFMCRVAKLPSLEQEELYLTGHNLKVVSAEFSTITIDIERKNRLLKVCYVPLLAPHF